MQKGSKMYKPDHQVCDDNPQNPRYVYVNRTTSLPSAWQGSETWVEFEIPQELGVWSGSTAWFDVTVTGTVQAPPTPYWISRHELYLGSDLLETVYANEHYHEVVGLRSSQDLDQINELVNINTDYTYTTSITTQRFYLPLEATMLQEMRPFVNGFNSKFKVRFYFPSSITASGAGTVVLSDFGFTVEEAQELKGQSIVEMRNAHRHGVVDYSVILRERQQDAVSLVTGTTQTLYLRSFNNDSAGLFVYVTPQAQTATNSGTRVVLKDVQILDETGNKITEILRSDFLNAFVWPTHIDSPFPNRILNSNNVYLIPFSAAVGEALAKGCNYGDRTFTSLERLAVTPTTTGTAMVNTVSLSYGFVTVTNGQHYFSPKVSPVRQLRQ